MQIVAIVREPVLFVDDYSEGNGISAPVLLPGGLRALHGP
jgi:hypothetical protein